MSADIAWNYPQPRNAHCKVTPLIPAMKKASRPSGSAPAVADSRELVPRRTRRNMAAGAMSPIPWERKMIAVLAIDEVGSESLEAETTERAKEKPSQVAMQTRKNPE